MAVLKQRLHKKNASGSYDTVYLETSASSVLMANGTTVENAVNGKAESNHTHTLASLGAQAASTAINTGNIGSQSVNYASSANYANSAGYAGDAGLVRTQSHADHHLNSNWNGSVFVTNVKAPDGGDRSVWVNNAGWADSAGYANSAGSIGGKEVIDVPRFLRILFTTNSYYMYYLYPTTVSGTLHGSRISGAGTNYYYYNTVGDWVEASFTLPNACLPAYVQRLLNSGFTTTCTSNIVITINNTVYNLGNVAGQLCSPMMNCKLFEYGIYPPPGATLTVRATLTQVAGSSSSNQYIKPTFSYLGLLV